MTVKLNIGCGPVQPDGWVNIDPDPRWGVHSVPGTDEEFIAAGRIADGAVAHHVLQMIPWSELVPWLTEVRACLKPGGWLRISVPDLELANWFLINGDRTMPGSEFCPPIDDEHERSIDGKVCLWLSQAGASRSVFTGRYLVELCKRAGFTRHHVTPYGQSLRAPKWLASLDGQPDRRHESVYVEARA